MQSISTPQSSHEIKHSNLDYFEKVGNINDGEEDSAVMGIVDTILNMPWDS